MNHNLAEDIAHKALRIYWWQTETAARRVAEYAADRIEELEAELAKALEALEGVRSFVRDLEPYADQGHTLVPALEKACNVFEELEGLKKWRNNN